MGNASFRNMIKYFLDVRAGPLSQRDTVGAEFPSLDAVKEEAIKTAYDLSRIALRDAKRAKIVVAVRDEVGGDVLNVAVEIKLLKI